jgi:hypothetical protein
MGLAAVDFDIATVYRRIAEQTENRILRAVIVNSLVHYRVHGIEITSAFCATQKRVPHTATPQLNALDKATFHCYCRHS